MTDPIADMLTRIRNALAVKKQKVSIPSSKIKIELAKILEKEGFIKSYLKEDGKTNYSDIIHIDLKYDESGAIINGLKKISNPGRRVYQGYKDMPKILPSLGIIIVSTPQGLMTNGEAKQKKIGGELICEIF